MAIAAGLVLLATFTLIERRTRDPIVPRRFLANRPLIIAVAIAFMFMATFGSLLYFLSIYFQDVRGYDPLQAGIAFLLPMHVLVTGANIHHHGAVPCNLPRRSIRTDSTGPR